MDGGRLRVGLAALASAIVLVAGVALMRLEDRPPHSEPPVFDAGAPLDPGDVRLPDEGIAAYVQGIGVVLMGIDGHVLGHLVGVDLRWGPWAGPIAFRGDRESYVIDGHRMRAISGVEGWLSSPLAYGAELTLAVDPDPGRAMVHRDGRAVLDLGNGYGNAWTISHNLDVVSIEDYRRPAGERHVAFDLQTDERWVLPEGCIVGDRRGARRYLICREAEGYRRGTVELATTTGGEPRLLVGPADDSGAWSSVMASPDGKQLLLSWWTTCDAPQTYIADASTGELLPIERWFEGTASGPSMLPLGWASSGAAIVRAVVDAHRCTPSTVAPGVYLLHPDGSSSQVLSLPADADVKSVAMWAPVPR